jgi:hypothetical protein
VYIGRLLVERRRSDFSDSGSVVVERSAWRTVN